MIATLSSGPTPASRRTARSRFARSSRSANVTRCSPHTTARRSGRSAATVCHARAKDRSVTPSRVISALEPKVRSGHPRDHARVVEAVLGVEDADAVVVAAGLDGLAVAEAYRHVRDRWLAAETGLRLTGEVEQQRARGLQRLLHRHRRALLLEPGVLVCRAVGDRHAGSGRGPLGEL